MTRKKRRSTICEIVASPRKRAAADRTTAAIRDHFPAGLAQPALRALARAGYSTLDQVAGVSESELASHHGMGPKAVGLIKAALRARGLILQP